jgi:hypothetical protein
MAGIAFVQGIPSGKQLEALRAQDALPIAADVAAERALTDAGITHKSKSSYLLPDNARNSVDWLNAWSCKPLQDGKNIKELLAHDDFSFWWCMEEWFWYSFTYRDSVSRVIETVDFVRYVLEHENPSQVWHADDGTLLSKVVRLLADPSRLRNLPTQRHAALRVKEFLRPWGIKQFFRAHARARQAAWALQGLRAGSRAPQPRGRHVLIANAYQWTTVTHPALTAPAQGDPYTLPVGEQLAGDTVTYVDCTQRAYRGFAALRSKTGMPQRYALLEQYYSLAQSLKTLRVTRRLQRAARALEHSAAFLQSWAYHGTDLWPLLAPQFRTYFHNRLEGHVRDYFCTESLFARERPDVVVYPCEGGDLAYIFFALAAKQGIPAIALQHGTSAYSPLTVHLPEEIGTGPACVPRATTYCVYGPYYRDFLARNTHFPPDSFVIVGNLRYDHFAARTCAPGAMRSKYGLNRRAPVVMFLTQILPLPQESEAIARAVFAATKKIGAQLIIKQHPGEASDALYHALAKEYALQPLITKTASTLELLTASDALIGAESTLDYEAMILDKPVIVVNLGGRPDTLPFVQDGAALGAYASDDVLPALQRALADEQTRKQLSERMRGLIAAHCSAVDGKAAARVAQVIKEATL